MSDIALVPNEGTSIAEMMGLPQTGSSSNKTQSSLASLSVLNDAIMGTVEVNGKNIKTELVPGTSFKFRISEDNIVYSDTVTVRTFAVRQRWAKWLSEENNYLKSIMANDLKSDLKDSKGGFNCGRPAGYVEDFHSLAPSIQQAMRSSRRTQVLLGMLQLDNPVDNEGNPLEEHAGTWYPFVYEIRAGESIKSINEVNSSLSRKNMLPIQHTVRLTGVERTGASGKPYAVFEASLHEPCDLQEKDNETLRDFMDWINKQNQYVLGEWDKFNLSSDTFDADDSALINSMVDVEESE
tara:strand:+ start:988 stop:1872 length:885 start_codon:yes stop_codon:yes gene_type:complete